MIKQKAMERFIRYAKIDTRSDEDSTTNPSTKKQFDLANLLAKELKELGVSDASVDEYCYVMGTIPSNCDSSDIPSIAWIAHVDTSPEVSGAGVKPQVIENYDGKDIVLPEDSSVVITVKENPNLTKCIGQSIVTSDGTTLLGADNKAGVAEIMTAVELIMSDNSISHGEIKICFTPDEEVGRGTEKIDLKKLGAKIAYTVDGEMPGEINKETFSANAATIRVKGRDIHPGFAKDIMVNSIRVISDIVAKLPRDMSPERTDGHKPFIHPVSMTAATAESEVSLILRDFETPGLDKQKEILEKVIAEVGKDHPGSEIVLEIKEQYRNMRDKLEERPEVTEKLFKAAELAGANPYWEPIRGGTDGSRLTEMGIPTPNIYTGGGGFHSKREWLSVEAMEVSVNTLIELAKQWATK